MTKESLKVGDRVAVYGTNFCGDVTSKRKLGTIHYIGHDYVNVNLDGHNENPYSFNSKQLRRLRPKKKPMRVECEVMFKLVTHNGNYYIYPEDENKEFDFYILEGKRGTLTFVEDGK